MFNKRTISGNATQMVKMEFKDGVFKWKTSPEDQA